MASHALSELVDKTKSINCLLAAAETLPPKKVQAVYHAFDWLKTKNEDFIVCISVHVYEFLYLYDRGDLL